MMKKERVSWKIGQKEMSNGSAKRQKDKKKKTKQNSVNCGAQWKKFHRYITGVSEGEEKM